MSTFTDVNNSECSSSLSFTTSTFGISKLCPCLCLWSVASLDSNRVRMTSIHDRPYTQKNLCLAQTITNSYSPIPSSNPIQTNAIPIWPPPGLGKVWLGWPCYIFMRWLPRQDEVSKVERSAQNEYFGLWISKLIDWWLRLNAQGRFLIWREILSVRADWLNNGSEICFHRRGLTQHYGSNRSSGNLLISFEYTWRRWIISLSKNSYMIITVDICSD